MKLTYIFVALLIISFQLFVCQANPYIQLKVGLSSKLPECNTQEYIDYVKQEFEKLHPDEADRVQFIRQGDYETLQLMKDDLTSRKYDILEVHGFMLGGLIDYIEPWYVSDELHNRFYQRAVNSYTIVDRFYGIPTFMHAHLLYSKEHLGTVNSYSALSQYLVKNDKRLANLFIDDEFPLSWYFDVIQKSKENFVKEDFYQVLVETKKDVFYGNIINTLCTANKQRTNLCIAAKKPSMQEFVQLNEYAGYVGYSEDLYHMKKINPNFEVHTKFFPTGSLEVFYPTVFVDNLVRRKGLNDRQHTLSYKVMEFLTSAKHIGDIMSGGGMKERKLRYLLPANPEAYNHLHFTDKFQEKLRVLVEDVKYQFQTYPTSQIMAQRSKEYREWLVQFMTEKQQQTEL